MIDEIIETDRLVLRKFCREDLDEIAEVLGNPEVMRFSLGGPYSREKSEKFIEACIRAYERRGVGLLAVVLKENRKVIGYCGFFLQTIDFAEETEIGYRLHPLYWNRGLATEAAKAIQDHAFERLGFVRLISIIEPQNVASIRVAEKCGMRYEKDTLFKGTIPVRIFAVRQIRR